MSLNKQLRAVPADFSRVGKLCDVLNMGWQKIPSYYYDVTQYQLPLTLAEFNQKVGGNIPVFSLEDSENGHQTNAAIGSSVTETFLAMGVGVVAIGEGEAFALPGLTVARPPSATPTPEVGDVCGDASGCNTGLELIAPLLNLPAGYAYDPHQAVLWYGGPTWRFIEKLFQAYRLNIFVNRRFMLVDESLFDVGMVPTPPEFVGASSSELSAMPFIQEVNEVMGEKNVPLVFMPQNTSLETTGVDVTATLQGAPPIASVTYGSPRIIGLSNRIFCFCNPILFCPGMRFDVKFMGVENDVAFRDAMRFSTVLNSDAPATPDPLFDAPVIGIVGEGEANVPDPISGVGISAGVFTIPGGTISLGLVFKGVALQPQAAVEYLSGYLEGGMEASLYAGNTYVAGLIRQFGGKNPGALGRLLKDKE